MTTRIDVVKNLLLIGGVFLLLLLPRWLASAQYATADETKWVARAANFSHALRHGDLSNTYQSEHPGVTTMWAGTVGLAGLFPDYAAQAPGQLAPHELDLFLVQQGYKPLQALVAGRQVMIFLNALALTLAFIYARRLLGLAAALLGTLFIALSPFIIAHTQLLHLDGLAGSVMLLSLLAFLAYAADSKWADLMIAGAAGGLAWLTKTPALALGPILLVIALLWGRRAGWRRAATTYLIWAAVAALTFFLLWPAMWVSPLSTLQRIVTGALGYAGGGHGDPVFFNGMIYSDGRIPASVWQFYPLTYLWRSTPVVLTGLALLVPALWRRWPPLNEEHPRRTIFALLLYALLFALFMTVGDKKFDRYLLPVYPALQLAAAAGWAGATGAIAKRWFHQRNVGVGPRAYPGPGAGNHGGLPLLVLVALWQLFILSGVYPYPLSYYNPLLGGSARAPQVMQIGWGEGLDEAGRYLAAQAGGSDLVVASWYRSALAYYFDGETLSIQAEMLPQELAAVAEADYAVIYIHQWQRNTPADLMEALVAREPKHIVTRNGLEYARIYQMRPGRE